MISDRGYLGQRPPIGASIKYGHPLAGGLIGCFLCNEGGGQIHDLVTGNVIPFVNSGKWGNAQFGNGLDCTAAVDSGVLTTTWSLLRGFVSKQISVLWRGVINASPGAFAPFFNVTYTNSNTTPFQAYSISTDTTGAKYSLEWNNNGAFQNLDQSPLSAFDGSERQVVGVLSGSTPAFNALYEGPGISLGAAGSVVFNPNFLTSQVGIGVYQNGIARTSSSICRHVYVWNRLLVPSDIATLFYNPYIFLQTARKRYWLGSSAVTLPETLSDQLPAWTEFLQVNNNQARDFGVISRDSFQLLDSLSLVGPPPNYFFVTGDKLNISEFQSLTEGYPLTKTDALALLDKVSNWLVVLQTFSDALSLSDQLHAIPGGLFLKISDQITTLLDAIAKAKGIGVSPTSNNFTFGDNITLSDSFTAKFATLMKLADQLATFAEGLGIGMGGHPADSMSLSDNVSLALTAFPKVTGTGADTLSLSDAVRTALNLPWIRLTVTENDTLSLSDSAIAVAGLEYNEPGFMNRLRRYLNDLN